METIRRLTHLLGLGQCKKTPVQVQGGLMHQMYHVCTQKGEYALKLLNEQVMKRKTALGNMILSERIAELFSEIVPAVAAVRINGNHVHLLDGRYCIVYPWVEGRSIFPQQIRPEHCEKIGQMLGRMHGVHLPVEETAKETVDDPLPDWRMFASCKETWAGPLIEKIPLLEEMHKKAALAKKELANEQVISHRDMDPKNVLWQNGDPLLIDWEAAGYVNPWQELMENLFYWADDGKGGLQKDRFQALIKAYGKECSLAGAPWEKALEGSVLGVLEWLHYNACRAWGTDAADEGEKALGRQQAALTLEQLGTWEEKKKNALAWLKE